MAFKGGVVPEEWRSAVIVTLWKDKGEMIKCQQRKTKKTGRRGL